jgi:hypothetical protein
LVASTIAVLQRRIEEYHAGRLSSLSRSKKRSAPHEVSAPIWLMKAIRNTPKSMIAKVATHIHRVMRTVSRTTEVPPGGKRASWASSLPLTAATWFIAASDQLPHQQNDHSLVIVSSHNRRNGCSCGGLGQNSLQPRKKKPPRRTGAVSQGSGGSLVKPSTD